MGFFDNIKKLVSVEDDEFEEELDFEEEETAPKKEPAYREARPVKNDPPRIFQSDRKSKTVNFAQSQMQVVLVKPNRFDDVTEIADHLNAKKTVVLNLETANRETSRRIIDFISGAAYANGASIKKVANSTFIVVPADVDIMGELIPDDFDDGNFYM